MVCSSPASPVVLALKVQWGELRRKESSPQIIQDPESQPEIQESSMNDSCEWIVAPPLVQPPTPASAEPPRGGLLPPDGGPIPMYDHPLADPQEPTTHLTVEPIRIKARGLLERRGSNTSLTLELVPTSTPPETSSPPSTCTGEQFLLTAGNRMGRRQLRQSLNEGRLLHAEFWEVPSNHPDRCEAPGSASRNRYRTVLPNDHSRVRIAATHLEGEYINANYIRGFDGEDRAYIATQGPLAHTVADLWTMVLQERAPAIVMITRLKEKGRAKCEPYIPEYSAHYENITVTVKQVIQKNGYTIRQIHLQQGEEEHETLHFWYTAWPDHKTPVSAKQLVSMAVQVEEVRKDPLGITRGPVVVHCSAGIGRTGCFIAISIGICQLHEEDAVDILAILCQMRFDRGGMVQTGEQYEFIHRAVSMYEEALPAIHTGK